MSKENTVEAAREIFIRGRTAEIFADPIDLSIAFADYIACHPTAAGQALKGAATGTIGDMLALNDLLTKAAEQHANLEWFKEVV